MKLLHGITPILLVFATGCTTLSTAIEKSATDYNEAVANSADEVILVNVLRSACGLPRHYTAVTQVTGNSTLTLNASTTATVAGDFTSRELNEVLSTNTNTETNVSSGDVVISEGSNAPDTLKRTLNSAKNTYTPSVGTSYVTNPSYVVGVLANQEFYRGITSPISTGTFGLYVAQGWPSDLLAHTLLEGIEFEFPDGTRVYVENDPRNLTWSKLVDESFSLTLYRTEGKKTPILKTKDLRAKDIPALYKAGFEASNCKADACYEISRSAKGGVSLTMRTYKDTDTYGWWNTTYQAAIDDFPYVRLALASPDDIYLPTVNGALPRTYLLGALSRLTAGSSLTPVATGAPSSSASPEESDKEPFRLFQSQLFGDSLRARYRLLETPPPPNDKKCKARSTALAAKAMSQVVDIAAKDDDPFFQAFVKWEMTRDRNSVEQRLAKSMIAFCGLNDADYQELLDSEERLFRHAFEPSITLITRSADGAVDGAGEYLRRTDKILANPGSTIAACTDQTSGEAHNRTVDGSELFGLKFGDDSARTFINASFAGTRIGVDPASRGAQVLSLIDQLINLNKKAKDLPNQQFIITQ
ncbi:MAG: hypothetical protein AAGA68_19890 [Pseudomonadota bacterium]